MKNETITFRLNENLKLALEAIAKKEDRTLSLQIQRFLKQRIAEHLKQNPDAEISNLLKDID